MSLGLGSENAGRQKTRVGGDLFFRVNQTFKMLVMFSNLHFGLCLPPILFGVRFSRDFNNGIIMSDLYRKMKHPKAKGSLGNEVPCKLIRFDSWEWSKGDPVR